MSKNGNGPKNGNGNGHGNGKIRLSKLDMDSAHLKDREEYDKRLSRLQKDLLHVQQTYWHEKRRAVILFEGWDAGGKGGAIRRLTEPLDPRGFHVWPIGAPRPDEQGRHYLYRFWKRLPEPGTFSIFDRSWYGRVMVERVEGFARKAEWKRAYEEIREFERMLTDDGVRLVKLFLHIDKDEQLNRFRERLNNPYKRWKLTEEDLRNRAKWDDYVEAVEDMFDETSTANAPWNAIPANSKWFTRVRVLELITEALKRDVDIRPPPIDPQVAGVAAEMLGVQLEFVTKPTQNGDR